MNQAQIRYFKEVLGVEQVLWKRPIPSAATLKGPRITIFVSKMAASERELFNKMIGAMKIATQDLLIIEDPSNEKYKEILSSAPILSLVFGSELAGQLGLQLTQGKFLNEQGIPTIVTYGPGDISSNPSLKSEAWKDMKLAMQRLGPA